MRRPEPTAAARQHPTIRTRLDLARHFDALGLTRGAEIGVADGRYSLALCQAIHGLSLRCVDPWRRYPGNPRGGPQSQHEANYQTAIGRLSPYRVEMVRAASLDAVRDVPDASLDFCYVDGNHNFDFVMLDLILWSAKVRPGGIVAGHDYYHFDNSGVVEAVNAYTAAHGIAEWWTTDERETSFWWVRA